jgi:plastocyanin
MHRHLILPLAALAAGLAACGGGGANYGGAPGPAIGPTVRPTAPPTIPPTTPPTTAPTTPPTANPQVIHIGFHLGSSNDPKFGAINFYSTGSKAQVITEKAGAQVVFLNDDGGPPHTGSGLGTGGFPAHFNNTSGATASGTTIDGSLTWSTGALNNGQMSQVLTVGPPGAYFFGCAFHYDSNQMRDVIVSN